ncbi:Oidioi.mRNA.OKI2018_I69.chr1.g1640.t1.cds [Oikopleura dioica]|uniref:Oidioi.mRNA.OKI2018_I69.chr1.g1640.t1.cds n=1 Tax=Oikopleura dioica TaxID=34765 RepID=A0ABN7SNJ7_OIKDI|nr:Oidioi.mRNA.OKI2018_I69.chr1.g1640.t1.cds [Oikopleura dioica]
MKLLNCLLAQIANAGYFQQYASLTAEERESRRVLCDSKVDETRAAFPVENGSWVCPGYGKTRSKVRCHPICGQGYLPDWTEKSISKPKKDAARFMARCGDPATIVRKNLPVGMELKCSAKPAHPCLAKAETIAIPDGRLELANKINKKRASYQVTRGNNAKNLGDRTFGLWKRSGQDTKLHLTVTDPADLSQFQYSGDYECAPGEWATFSVEVRQEKADPSTIRFTTKMGRPNFTPAPTLRRRN